MDFSEIIGFLIVLFVFFIPLLRKLLIDKKRAEQKEEIIEEEEEVIEVQPPPSPPRIAVRPHTTERLVKRDYAFETKFQERKYQSQISQRELETHEAPKFRERIVSEDFLLETRRKGRTENPLVSIVKKRSPMQAMIILSEILNRKGE